MAQVHGSKDCGNSPKNKFVQDVAVALECGEAIPGAFSEIVIWEIASMQPISGKDTVFKEFAARPKASSIVVQHAISHGKVRAACGEATFTNGDTRRFCHVFEFTNAKGNCVAVIRSYG